MSSVSAHDVAAAKPKLADDVTCFKEEGAMRLKGPKLRRGRGSRLMAWLFRLPSRVEVELDAIGAFVVSHMDGKTTMTELRQLLSEKYRLTRREAEMSLTAFVQSLLKRRLITMDGLIGSSV